MAETVAREEGSAGGSEDNLRGAPGGLWRDREFGKLWAGEMVSLFGTQITLLALPLAAVSLGASAFEMGALRAAQWLPFLLLALPAGLWLERRRRRPVLVLSNLGQAALFSLPPLLALLGVLSVGHLVAVAFLAGACAVLFELAYHSYLPRLVGREDLVEANGKLMTSMSASEVGGPGLGGVLVGMGESMTLATSSPTRSGSMHSNNLTLSPSSTGARWTCSSSTSPASRCRLTVSAPSAILTSFPPAAAFACSIALSMPSVTKVKVVPRCLTHSSLSWWVRTNTRAPKGGGSGQPTSPSSNIRLPVT